MFDRRMGNAGQRLDGLITKTAVSSSGTNTAAAAASVSIADTNLSGDSSTIDMIALERRVFALETFLGSATNAIDMEHSHSGHSGTSTPDYISVKGMNIGISENVLRSAILLIPSHINCFVHDLQELVIGILYH